MAETVSAAAPSSLGSRAAKVFVPLSRAYGWHDEQGNYVEYGPGDSVEIPRKMAEGLVKAGVLSAESFAASDGKPAAAESFAAEIAQRQAELDARVAVAAGALAERLGLVEEAAALDVLNDDSDQARLLRAEFVAEFLERLADAEGDALVGLEEIQQSADEIVATTEQFLLARIEAIDGIGPKTMELIRNGLKDDELSVTVQMDSEGDDEPDAAAEAEQP